MIEVRNLTKTYPGAVALDAINFTVAKGEVCGFVGPNGAGKTTTMRILTGFMAPTDGSATVGGHDVVRHSLEVRRRVGYLPESNPLYLEMRVREYLRFRATLKGVERSRREAAVDSAVERCNLGDVSGRIIGHLSKGYRQRIGLADAIVHEPEIVILDEPTIGLDPNQVRDVRKLILDLGREGKTVLLSTHILSEVEKVCGRVIIIVSGRIKGEGTPGEISHKLTATGRVRLDVRGGAAGVRDALLRIRGITGVVEVAREGGRNFLIETSEESAVVPEVVRAASAGNWEVLELGPERKSLEDAFVALTERSAASPGDLP